MNYNQNKQDKETSTFRPKSWTNPFAKNGNFSALKYQRFCSLEKVFLCQEWHQIHFLINLKEKYQGEETSFQKMQVFHLSKIKVFSGNKRLFSIKNVAKHSFRSIWTRKNKVRKL